MKRKAVSLLVTVCLLCSIFISPVNASYIGYYSTGSQVHPVTNISLNTYVYYSSNTSTSIRVDSMAHWVNDLNDVPAVFAYSLGSYFRISDLLEDNVSVYVPQQLVPSSGADRVEAPFNDEIFYKNNIVILKSTIGIDTQILATWEIWSHTDNTWTKSFH